MNGALRGSSGVTACIYSPAIKQFEMTAARSLDFMWWAILFRVSHQADSSVRFDGVRARSTIDMYWVYTECPVTSGNGAHGNVENVEVKGKVLHRWSIFPKIINSRTNKSEMNTRMRRPSRTSNVSFFFTFMFGKKHTWVYGVASLFRSPQTLAHDPLRGNTWVYLKKIETTFFVLNDALVLQIRCNWSYFSNWLAA